MKKLIFMSGLLLLASSKISAQQRDGSRNNRAGTNPNRGIRTMDRNVNHGATIDNCRVSDQTTDISRRSTSATAPIGPQLIAMASN